MFEVVLFYVLMVAPSATDNHVQNYAVPLGVYETSEDCMDAANWINEHKHTLDRQIWCMPVGVKVEGVKVEGEPA